MDDVGGAHGGGLAVVARAQKGYTSTTTCDVFPVRHHLRVRKLSHEMQQAVVCRRFLPIRSASVAEHWNA
jgi:hypothetical protein